MFGCGDVGGGTGAGRSGVRGRRLPGLGIAAAVVVFDSAPHSGACVRIVVGRVLLFPRAKTFLKVFSPTNMFYLSKIFFFFMGVCLSFNHCLQIRD